MSDRIALAPREWRRLVGALGTKGAIAGAGDAAERFAPLALLRPEDQEGVAIVLRTAKQQRVPVVVSGAGSRLGVGGQAPAGGHLRLETGRLTGIEEIHPQSLWLTARAGTRLEAVAETAAEVGCRLVGVDPDDAGTVGGWLASRTRIPDDILGIPQPITACLEGVLPGGVPIRSVRTPRAAVGPDLFSLLTGTHGTLGVITGATLKLEPMPERRLIAGFRFSSLERAVRFVRACLAAVVPPRRLQMMIDGQKGRRMARVWFSVEGQAALASAAMRSLRALAADAGAKPRDLDRVRAWRETAAFRGRRVCEAAVRWSRLVALLRGADRLMGGYAFAVIDRPELTGCRLRVALPKAAGGDLRPGWTRLVDPEGDQAAALERARGWLQAIRAQIDPDGLLNPQAWPPEWDGGLP